MDAEQKAAFARARLSRDNRFDGRFFVAVKTTGIFCRPVCKVRLPKEDNVTYYFSAQQAMQAGFRPCLRCRPDSAPGSWAWLGTQTTVRRACRLLASSNDTVEQISDRLGISARYLHQRMIAAIGVSPKQYQLQHQVLFAKRLLHESSLGIEDIAQTVGFGSARRLQIAMKKVTGLTPTQVRSNKVKVDGQLTLLLRYRPPYDWCTMRDFLARRCITQVEAITEHGYQRNILCKGKPGRIVALHDPLQNGFWVTLECDDLSLARELFDNMMRVLDVDAEPDVIASALAESGLAPQQINEGLRLPGAWDSFEAGCRAILGQQVSVGAAIKLLNQLASELGQPAGDGMTFPLPQSVAEHELTFLRMPGARREALRAFAQACCGESAEDMSEAQLLALRGIGPWTVDYIMLRGRSEPDRWLAGDAVIKQQLKNTSLQPQSASPWRSYLTLQLWHLAG